MTMTATVHDTICNITNTKLSILSAEHKRPV